MKSQCAALDVCTSVSTLFKPFPSSVHLASGIMALEYFPCVLGSYHDISKAVRLKVKDYDVFSCAGSSVH